ncbi:MAG: P27 family phage terminase small subunit [Candidatus Krumholzibacteria bacterium]|nr:P27 family phage terminase small subunit [Candidatus Krumholzibacteria bacterium]
MEKAPTGLSAGSKGIWKALVKEWVLDRSNLVLLQTALEAYDRMIQAKRQVDKDGITVKSPSGLVRPHPALKIEKEAGSRFLQAFKMIGFNLEPPRTQGRPTGR